MTTNYDTTRYNFRSRHCIEVNSSTLEVQNYKNNKKKIRISQEEFPAKGDQLPPCPYIGPPLALGTCSNQALLLLA